MRHLYILLLLTGCAVQPATHIDVIPLDRAALTEACSKYVGDAPARAKSVPNLRRVSGQDAMGCFRRRGDYCAAYVLIGADEDTIEHERRHCREGYFH